MNLAIGWEFGDFTISLSYFSIVSFNLTWYSAHIADAIRILSGEIWILTHSTVIYKIFTDQDIWARITLEYAFLPCGALDA
jgi:hypothetical protein